MMLGFCTGAEWVHVRSDYAALIVKPDRRAVLFKGSKKDV